MKKTLLLLSIFLFSIYQSNSFSQNGLSFDGINDYVNCGTDTSLHITGTAITMEAWIYPTSWKTNVWQGNIISKEGIGTGYMLRAGANGTLNMNVGNGPGPGSWHELSSTTGTLTLNTWQHIAGTYDGSYLRIYKNGVLIDSLAKTISITATTTTPLYIGESPAYSGRYFPGIIDEVRVWNVAKTKAEILTNMNNELCILPPNLKAYYTFNQGIASGANSTVTTATDLSGNNNTGTLTGFTLSGSTSNWVTGVTITPGIVTSTNTISACGSYTMPDGRIITTAGTYYDTLPSSSPCDSLVGYIISFPPAIISNTITDAGCVNYTTALGTMITSSGTYYDTISSGTGCDTTVRYIITISGAVDDSVYRVGGRITSWDTWAAHQWVRCDSNFAPIAGETSRFIVATQPGDYAVIVTRGSCVDTSDCVNIVLSSINENEIDLISVFPNPTSDNIFINNLPNQAMISIYNIEGRMINTYYHPSKIDVSAFSEGVYYLEINANENRKVIKFVKK